MRDPNSDVVYAALEREFGGPIHDWPRPDSPDSFRASKSRISRALAMVGLPAVDPGFEQRFWLERQHGQLDEDAGGFLWRCWCAALQVPNEFLDRYGRGRAPQVPTTAVDLAFAGVIKLEWRISRADPSIGESTAHYGSWFGGHYHAGRTGKIWGAGTFNGRGASVHVGYFRSLAEAKAAAQAHLDARFQEALTASAAQQAA